LSKKSDSDELCDINELCDFLLSILQLLDLKLAPIYLILDRIDACSGDTSQGELTKALLRIVQKAPSTCKVKVLIATCNILGSDEGDKGVEDAQVRARDVHSVSLGPGGA